MSVKVSFLFFFSFFQVFLQAGKEPDRIAECFLMGKI